ncbi:uncharacterized protein [Mytilus edulis]|uniref:uncharacterized protein isoform X2 n=1 Tax=Mytilus edulis TaxID=6550 RepID=UPI0039EE5AFB
MVCVVGKGHYMFDSEEYSTVKTLSINTLSPDTYIAITGRHLRTVLITDGQVLCQNVDSPPNTKVVFGEHVCKPSAESTSDEASPEYENTSLANTTSSTEGLPAWVSSVISSTIDWIIYIIVTIIAVSELFLRGNQNLRRRLETILQVINYLKNLQNNNLPQQHRQLPQQQIEPVQQPNLRRSQRRRFPVARLNL